MSLKGLLRRGKNLKGLCHSFNLTYEEVYPDLEAGLTTPST